MSTSSIQTLYDALREDRWRASHPFSPDIVEANALLHHPYAYEDEIADGLREWCLKKQPCQFGRVAAKYGLIHFCILTERHLREGDEAIRAKVAEEKRLWKQRAVYDRHKPPHGFMLLLASPRVALAAPDDNLMRFASHVRDLAGWVPTRSSVTGNPVTSDFLYLRNPEDGFYYGFQFNVDFFASAGDGRWWHDHRVPGGIGFTANSTGHMRHFQEWYSERGRDRGEWFITQAMKTIAQAHPTASPPHRQDAPDQSMPGKDGGGDHEGRVTWLRELVDGMPFKDSPCPFKATIPGTLQGKDWTTYEGLLHTDHAIRAEFFQDREKPSTQAKPYLMDFTYLHDQRESDFVKFMAGVRVAERDVYAEIGTRETWEVRSGGGAPPPRSAEATSEIHKLLDACNNWKVDPNLLDESPVL